MTAKEFLSKYYPKVIVRKYSTRKIGGESAYCCRYGAGQIWLAQGETASEALNNAALEKAKEIVRAKYPNAYYMQSLRDYKFYIFLGDDVLSKHKNQVRAWILAAEEIEKNKTN